MDVQNASHDEWEAQLIDYSVGAMEPEEAASFEERLAECRRHVLLARDYGTVAGMLGTAVPAADPPAGHRSRLMSRVSATPQASATTITPAEPAPAQVRPALRALP